MSSVEIDRILQIEKRRKIAAMNKNIKQFKALYNKSVPGITNLNTGMMWDILNKDEITFSDNPMSYQRIQFFYKIINEFQKVKKAKIKVLDVGFGSQILEKALYKQKQSFDVTGIDISRDSVEKATQEFKTWKFIQGSVPESLSKTMSKFDVIVASEIFEHIDHFKILNLIKKLQHKLNTGGLLIVSVPINEPLQDMLLQGRNPNAHTRYYYPETLRYELKINGLNAVFENHLYAFSKYYFIKSIIALILERLHIIKDKYNNLIIVSRK